MSTEMMIIIGLSVVALIIGVILAAKDGGPRVTIIKRKTKQEGDDE